MESYGIIYKITNAMNGKSYIGQTTQKASKRWTAHKVLSAKPRWPIHRAMFKHGVGNFSFEVIEHCSDRSSLDAAECRWIAEIGSRKPLGYNVTEGGGGAKGYRFSDEARRKLGDRMRGRYVGPEIGRKISASKTGYKMKEETRLKMAASRTGKSHPEEVRQKIGASQKGRKLSPEQIEMIRSNSSGRRHSDEAKAKLSRPVVADGIDFGSLSDAAAALCVSITTIQRRIEKGVPGYSSEKAQKKTRRPRTAEQIAALKFRLSKAVTAEGIPFQSATEAALALGISRQVVRYRIGAGFAGYAMKEAA